MKQGLLLILIYSQLVFSCQEDPEEYLKHHKRDLLRVKTDSPVFPADGKTYMTISAFIPANSDLKTVVFTSTSGTFHFADSNSYSVDATVFMDSLRAQAFLVSDTEIPSKFVVKVTAASIDTTLTLNYSVAYADSISNESTVASIKRGYGSEVPVKTNLIRKTGIPSQHQFVQFRGFKSNKNEIGEFRDISPGGSDKNGIVNSIFVLKDTTYTGPIKIASIYKGQGSIHTDTLLVFVTQK